MEEGFTFTGPGGNVIRSKKIGLKAVYPEAAVCMECGEISLYIDAKDLEKLKK